MCGLKTIYYLVNNANNKELILFTCVYKSVAIRADSETFRQSINQNRAETVVVNDTQSLTNESGVEPVTSSHTALFCPPIFFRYHKEKD